MMVRIEGFVGFTGLPRTGKTLACTYMALSQANPVGGIRGNYKISYVNHKVINPYHLVKFLEKKRVPVPVTLATHEVYSWMDSYLFVVC